MKKLFITALAALCFTACQETLEERAARALNDYTEKNCPMQVGPSIIMDSCRFEGDTHTLHYFYRFTDNMDNDSVIDPVRMRQLLVDALKNETSSRVYKEAGYNFQYTYRSQRQPDKVMLDVTMTREDYQ